MMRHTRALGLAVLLGAAACSEATGTNGEPPALITALPRQLTSAEQAIAQATPDFAVAFLKAVNTSFADGNVFISPLSASMALGMTLNGVSGDTYTEMRAAIGLPDRPLAELNAGYRGLITLLRALDKTVDFRIANSVWYEQTFWTGDRAYVPERHQDVFRRHHNGARLWEPAGGHDHQQLGENGDEWEDRQNH